MRSSQRPSVFPAPNARRAKMTRAQRLAIRQKWKVNRDGAESYRAFFCRFQRDICGDYLLGRWCGMWLGIEPDGYTHS